MPVVGSRLPEIGHPIRCTSSARSCRSSAPRIGLYRSKCSCHFLIISGWVGTAAIVRHFGVSVRTIESWLVNGLPHALPSSRMVRFLVSDCESGTTNNIGCSRGRRPADCGGFNRSKVKAKLALSYSLNRVGVIRK